MNGRGRRAKGSAFQSALGNPPPPGQKLPAEIILQRNLAQGVKKQLAGACGTAAGPGRRKEL